MRAFLYARVSTGDQNEGMQTREMLEMCERWKWSPTVFADPGWSGAKEKRPELDHMMVECRRRKCDVVMVYKFDRFARSLRQLVNTLAEFDALGIQFVSVHEQINTTTPQGRFFFHVFAALAEFEREMLRGRVRSAMDLRKDWLRTDGFFISKKGRRCETLGRPTKQADLAYILQRREQAAPWDVIAAELNVSVSTCQRAVLRASKGVFSRTM